MTRLLYTLTLLALAAYLIAGLAAIPAAFVLLVFGVDWWWRLLLAGLIATAFNGWVIRASRERRAES